MIKRSMFFRESKLKVYFSRIKGTMRPKQRPFISKTLVKVGDLSFHQGVNPLAGAMNIDIGARLFVFSRKVEIH